MQAPVEFWLPQFPAHSSGAETLELKVVVLPSVGMGRDWDVLHPFTIHSTPSQLFRKRSEEHLQLQTPPHHDQIQLLNKWALISEEASIKEDDTGGDLGAAGTCSFSLCQNSICPALWVRCEPRAWKILDISISLNSRTPFLFGVVGMSYWVSQSCGLGKLDWGFWSFALFLNFDSFYSRTKR